MTVRANIETVVVTEDMSAKWDDFKDRTITYTLTAPQSFQATELLSVLKTVEDLNNDGCISDVRTSRQAGLYGCGRRK